MDQAADLSAHTEERDPFALYETGPGAIPEAQMSDAQRLAAAALAEAAQHLLSPEIRAGYHSATAQAVAAAQLAEQVEVAGLADAASVGVVP